MTVQSGCTVRAARIAPGRRHPRPTTSGGFHANKVYAGVGREGAQVCERHAKASTDSTARPEGVERRERMRPCSTMAT